MNQSKSDLVEAFQKLASTRKLNETLTVANSEAAKLVNGEGCSIWLVDKNDPNKIVCAKTYAKDARVEEGKSFYEKKIMSNNKHDGLTGWVFANGKILNIKNITDKKEIEQISDSLKWGDKCGGWKSQKPPRERTRPFLAIPIFDVRRPNEVIGVIRIATKKNRQPFSKQDENLICAFATMLSHLIANDQRRYEESELFSSLYKMGAISDLDHLLDCAVAKFRDLFESAQCSVLLANEKEEFFIRASSADNIKEQMLNNEIKPYIAGEGKTGQVIASGKSVLFIAKENEPLKSIRPKTQCETISDANSFIASPLVNKDGKLIGVIRSAKSDPHPRFTIDDKELLETYAKQISYMLSVIEENRRLIYKNIYGVLAPLLPINDLEQLIRDFSTPTYKELTIMYVDLNKFTAFCDSVLGKDSKQIIDTLNTFFNMSIPLIIKYGGTVDKFEGDGFIALFNGYEKCENHANKAIKCAIEIREAFDRTFKRNFINHMNIEYGRILDDDDFTLGLKIGIGTAEVVLGLVGCIMPDGLERRDFTFIGQEANLISRLVSDVPKQLIENRSKKNTNTVKFILCTHKTFKQLDRKLVKYNEHIVDIRGAGAGRGKAFEKQRVYEIIST